MQRRAWTGKPKQRGAMVLAITLVIALAPLIQIRPAAAADGLAIGSTTTFRVQPEEGIIEVEAVYTATNVTPNRTSRGRVTQYYYNGMNLPIPVEATDLEVLRSDGRSLATTRTQVDPDIGLELLEVRFGRNVFYRSTTTFTVSYVLRSGEARDFDSLVRVNPAYAVFEAFGAGDDNAVSVRVEVPKAFDVTITGSEYFVRLEDEINVYEATDIPNPEEFYLFVVARNDDALATRIVPLGEDGEIAIRSWPGDEVWADFVERELDRGFVELQELVGLPFPDDELEIVESVDPLVRGYAGWYVKSEQLIEVSEELDSETLLHELSHAWFNRELFRERWISEGLASEFAARSLEATGESLPVPGGVRSTGPYRTDLNRWIVPYTLDAESQETERYGYDASWLVMRRLSGEIGIDGLAEIVAAADGDLISYVGEGDRETVEASVDNWRRFLDLAQQDQASESIESLYRDYVVTDVEKEMLDERAVARASYGELSERSAVWAPPAGLRFKMDLWDFDTAQLIIEEATTVLDAREAIKAGSEPLGLEMHSGPEVAYEAAESAEELTELASRLEPYLPALETLAEAQTAVEKDYGIVASVGLWRTDYSTPYAESRNAFEAGDISEAKALGEQTILGFAEAGQRGRTRLLTAVGTVLAALVAVAALRRMRRRRGWADTERSDPTESLPETAGVASPV